MEYVETFDNGPGGWFGWDKSGLAAVGAQKGVIASCSPWWVDYNHAPPGGGYLHILFALYTKDGDRARNVAGENRFLTGGFPTDFTNAKVTVKIKGEVDRKGAELVLLAQSDVTEPRVTRVNSVLTGQPILITPVWSEQTITCVPDNGQWTCLGSRHDRNATYGWGPIAPVLRDLNCDIIFVLFPLDIVPAQPVEGDIHIPRAGQDYAVDESRLPSGYVMLDEVRIEFPGR
jgi:hypothetical protein